MSRRFVDHVVKGGGVTAAQLIQTIERLAKENAEPTLLGVPVVFMRRSDEAELSFDGVQVEDGVVYIWIKS